MLSCCATVALQIWLNYTIHKQAFSVFVSIFILFYFILFYFIFFFLSYEGKMNLGKLAVVYTFISIKAKGIAWWWNPEPELRSNMGEFWEKMAVFHVEATLLLSVCLSFQVWRKQWNQSINYQI